ncbi:hypothetical protein [Pseudomonas sp. CC6-YY-74]|uniref:hypothetical protein n=1 Tax=Pseudomonas sp. CC6-YY-74 TaxID=1930532 RepID=UPI0009A14497|nr:hypothetical protein [Pseudomonas sp. CC6-YY-74]
MFETFPDTEIQLSPFLRSNTVSWEYVVQPIFVPWFYVSWVVTPCGEDPQMEMRLLPNIYALKHHIEIQDEETFILDTQLVSPGHLNGSGMYQMQPLAKVIAYTETIMGAGAHKEFAYELKDGARYPRYLDWASLESIDVVYDSSMIHLPILETTGDEDEEGEEQ